MVILPAVSGYLTDGIMGLILFEDACWMPNLKAGHSASYSIKFPLLSLVK